MNKFNSRHFSDELVRIGFSFEKDQPCQLMGRKHEVNNLDLWLSLLGCAQRAFEDGYYCFCGDSSGNRHQLKLDVTLFTSFGIQRFLFHISQIHNHISKHQFTIPS